MKLEISFGAKKMIEKTKKLHKLIISSNTTHPRPWPDERGGREASAEDPLDQLMHGACRPERRCVEQSPNVLEQGVEEEWWGHRGIRVIVRGVCISSGDVRFAARC